MPDCCQDENYSGLNILVAGQNPLIHSLMPGLYEAGHCVSITITPKETLFTYASQQPDLIVFADQENSVSTFTAIREVNPEAEAMFMVDSQKPEFIETIYAFHQVSFIPAKATQECFLSAINRFQKQATLKKKNEADAKLYDLILQSLPFPALLLCGKKMAPIFTNKAARRELPHKDFTDHPPFMENLSDDLCYKLFTDIESYRIHSLESVPAYGRYWDLTIEQVAPSVFMLLAIDTTDQRRQMQFREEMERITRHDLRSPTATIVGLSRVLETEAGLEDEFLNIAEILRKTSERMIRQIDTSLTLIRLETGSLKTEAYPFNLYTAISAAVGDLSQLVEDKHLEIVSLLDGEPAQEESTVVCFGEAALIITMFSNLLKNAAEAAPEHSRITISIREEKDFIITEIHNVGEIPASIRNNFFDRYTTYGKKNGTGLGTYSARLIAKASGGDISFTTSGEKGTTLITSIPKPQ
ncbi:HAMP domain-containing sensor histidine kinase [Maridesulfovibrio sp.]|uniref:sensor histidine kinase n=1 Tax=Maridesulfovibrio sp. TaxID=2795000 RepID=UPI002A18CC94|nr:HAMP domain-containing sensor histidine kinase [Maridesulfovibrio sp.]